MAAAVKQAYISLVYVLTVNYGPKLWVVSERTRHYSFVLKGVS